MAEHNETGEKGEEIALEYLIQKGYRILERNWRFRKSELDIIAKKNKSVVFIEVKTRTSSYFENPKEAVTKTKQRNIILGANAYIEQRNINLEARFDIISVLLENNQQEVEHVIDAFYPMV